MDLIVDGEGQTPRAVLDVSVSADALDAYVAAVAVVAAGKHERAVVASGAVVVDVVSPPRLPFVARSSYSKKTARASAASAHLDRHSAQYDAPYPAPYPWYLRDRGPS